MIKIKILVLFIYIFPFLIYSESIEVKRITPAREIVDWGMNTPNAHLPYYPYSITEAHDKIFIGGDFSYIISIDKKTWTINRFAGSDLYNRVTLIAGSKDSSKIPDGITDMRFDSVNNRLWMSSWFYHNIMYYDFEKDYFDNFSGEPYVTGNARGKGRNARYNYISYIAISPDGKYIYACDKKNNIIVKIEIKTSISSILAGKDGERGYVDGEGLTINVRLKEPDGICVSADGKKIFFYDNDCIRVIVINEDKCYTLYRIGPGFKSLVLDSNNKHFYTCNIAHSKIVRIRVKDGYVENFTNGGNGDNYTSDFKVNRLKAKFRGADNIEIRNDYLYICDTHSLQLKTLDLKTGEVSRLLGFSWWSGNYQPASFTGWGEITGFDYYGNTLIVSTGKQRMICKIYENGIKEDIAGDIKKENIIYKDGYKDESVCLNPYGGVVVIKDNEPWYFFKDQASIRVVNLNTNYLKTFIGVPDIPGYADGYAEQARLSALPGQLAYYDKYIYLTEREYNIIRRINIDTRETKTIAGQYQKSADMDYCNNLKKSLLGWPSGIWIDPKSNGKLIYFWDSAYGKCKLIDLEKNRMNTVFMGGGNVNSIAGRYINNKEKIIYFYNNNIGYQIKINAYNVKSNIVDKIIGFSSNNLYIGDKDGDQYKATVDYYNFTMKFYEDKNMLLFDTLGSFNNLRYIIFK